MVDLFLPATDRGAIVQAVVVIAALLVTLVMVRRHREYRTFVLGLLFMSAAWFSLRTIH